jgi:hypothetical protein
LSDIHPSFREPFEENPMKHALFAATLALVSIAAPAASAPPTFGCPRSLAQYHEFDFWIGHWEVRDPAGKAVVGHSRIEAVSDGCGIAEHWQGTSGSNGVSYNAWDPETGHWHQFWIGNGPDGVLALEGGIANGSMVLTGKRTPAKTSRTQQQRITWTPNSNGTVRQHWETSGDGGKTWITAFDGIYRKVAE